LQIAECRLRIWSDIYHQGTKITKKMKNFVVTLSDKPITLSAKPVTLSAAKGLRQHTGKILRCAQNDKWLMTSGFLCVLCAFVVILLGA
jgi:hypothetical protein